MILDIPKPSKGLIFSCKEDTDFISPSLLIPRKHALQTTGMYSCQNSEALCLVLLAYIKAQMKKQGTLRRGKCKHIFADEHQAVQYYSLGSQVNRAIQGVHNNIFHYKYMTDNQVKTIQYYVTSCESVINDFFCANNVRKMWAASEILDYNFFLQ